MANSYTAKLRFPLLDGPNRNVWGGLLNKGLDIAEDAVTGIVSIDVTNSDVVLSTANGLVDQARYAVVRVTGDPGTARTIVFPNITKMVVAVNDTDPGFDVVFGTSSGGVTVNPGGVVLLFVDSSINMVRAVSAGGSAVLAPTSIPAINAGVIPSLPASGNLNLRGVVYGNMFMGLAKIDMVPFLSTATTIFGTSPYITAALSPLNNLSFAMDMYQDTTQVGAYLTVMAGGADWVFSRTLGVFAATTDRSLTTVGYQPIFYPLV